MSIIIPNGGHVINDATATADDVVTGKVFYNNGGKVEGTLPISSYAEIKSVTLPLKRSNSYNTFTYRIMYMYKTNGALDFEDWTGTVSQRYTSSISLTYTHVLYISIGSTTVPLAIHRKCTAIVAYEKVHTNSNGGSTYEVTDYGVYVKSGKIYTYSDNDSYVTLPTINLYYI